MFLTEFILLSQKVLEQTDLQLSHSLFFKMLNDQKKEKQLKKLLMRKEELVIGLILIKSITFLKSLTGSMINLPSSTLERMLQTFMILTLKKSLMSLKEKKNKLKKLREKKLMRLTVMKRDFLQNMKRSEERSS